jgi:hypothetical protein
MEQLVKRELAEEAKAPGPVPLHPPQSPHDPSQD